MTNSREHQEARVPGEELRERDIARPVLVEEAEGVAQLAQQQRQEEDGQIDQRATAKVLRTEHPRGGVACSTANGGEERQRRRHLT